jgi:hypothetical protein
VPRTQAHPAITLLNRPGLIGEADVPQVSRSGLLTSVCGFRWVGVRNPPRRGKHVVVRGPCLLASVNLD